MEGFYIVELRLGCFYIIELNLECFYIVELRLKCFCIVKHMFYNIKCCCNVELQWGVFLHCGAQLSVVMFQNSGGWRDDRKLL